LAHRVTVFGSTRNIAATSAGVSKGSDSGGRAFTRPPPCSSWSVRARWTFGWTCTATSRQSLRDGMNR
jgi:hypothetical protein